MIIAIVPCKVSLGAKEVPVIACQAQVPRCIHIVIFSVKGNYVPCVVLRVAGIIRHTRYVTAINVKLKHQSVKEGCYSLANYLFIYNCRMSSVIIMGIVVILIVPFVIVNDIVRDPIVNALYLLIISSIPKIQLIKERLNCGIYLCFHLSVAYEVNVYCNYGIYSVGVRSNLCIVRVAANNMSSNIIASPGIACVFKGGDY